MIPVDFRRRLLPRAGLVLLALPLAAATTPPGPPRPRFEESTQVVAVEVPVNAVDRGGRPVRGLTAADFEVFDEGARQTVTHFEVVDLDSLRRDQSPEQLRAGAVGTAGDLEAIDAAVRRHFLLLFDISFSSPTALLRARLAARDFVLHSLRPTDLVAVATYSLATGPRLVLTFTPDRGQLAHAVDTLGFERSEEAAKVAGDPLHFIITSPSALGEETALAAISAQAPDANSGSRQAAAAQAQALLLENLVVIRNAADRDQRAYERGQVTAYARALASMAKALDSVKGRKTVVYFSEGFDGRLLLGREDLSSDEAAAEQLNVALGNTFLVDNDKRYGNTGLQNTVHEMLEQFRRADCVIQAIDIGGLRATSDATSVGGARPVTGQSALFYLANETGGELFKDANNFREQLERVLERTTVTYLLTFQRSDLKPDGAYHRLRVKTRAPGVRLSHRAGYYAPRSYRELNAMERELLAAQDIAAAGPSNGIDLSVLAAPFRSGERLAYVPVIIEVGGRSLLAGEKGDRVDLEIYTYAINRQGQMRDFFTRKLALDLQKGRQVIESTGVKYYGHLDLPAGEYQVRVLVRNAQSGRSGVRSAAMSVPAYQKRQPVLLPPLFLEASHSWLLVREHPKSREASVVYPFLLKGEPYVPAAHPALSRDDKARLCLVGYNLGQGDLAVEGSVTAADGKPLPGGSLSLVERTATGVPGLDELEATFQPTGLAAGDYVLQVALTDRATGHKEINSLPFQVVR
jgi:VWFA-related protein